MEHKPFNEVTWYESGENANGDIMYDHLLRAMVGNPAPPVCLYIGKNPAGMWRLLDVTRSKNGDKRVFMEMLSDTYSAFEFDTDLIMVGWSANRELCICIFC